MSADTSSTALPLLAMPDGLPAKMDHYIAGRSVPSVDGSTFDVLEPVSNTVYGTAAAGGAAEIEMAVAAAQAAFDDGAWSEATARQRANVLVAIANAVEVRGEEPAQFETFDTGLPISQARGQAARAAENFRFFADIRARCVNPAGVGGLHRRAGSGGCGCW